METGSNFLAEHKGKMVTVFGGFSEVSSDQSADISELGLFLSSQNSSASFLIGGVVGYLKSFIKDIPKRSSRICLIGSMQGKEKGFHSEYENELPSLFFDGYFGKKKMLFDVRVASFLILPDGGTSLGALTELIEAIDQVKSFDLLVDQTPRPIVFYGKHWKTFLESIIYPRINDVTKSCIHFVDEGDYKSAAKMLKLI